MRPLGGEGILLPDGLQEIGEYAFAHVLPFIGANENTFCYHCGDSSVAFLGCAKLKEVELPEGLQEIVGQLHYFAALHISQ